MDLPHFRPCRATILVVVVVRETHQVRLLHPTRTVSEVVPECEDPVRAVSTVYTPVLAASHGLSLLHLVPLLGTPRSPPRKDHINHKRKQVR